MLPPSPRGVTLFQKVGVPVFVSFRSVGVVRSSAEGARIEAPKAPRGEGETPSQPGEVSREGDVLLLSLEKAHFGAYPMHYDVLILKLRFVVHTMLQLRLWDRLRQFFSSTGCSSWGLAPNPDKLRPCLSPFSSHAFPVLLFSSSTSLSLPN